VDVVVGQEDDGRHARLRPGHRLRVELDGDHRPVTVSDAALLEPLRITGGYATGQPMIAVLTAISPGEVLVSSSTDFECLHDTMPCALPQAEWALSVTVAAD